MSKTGEQINRMTFERVASVAAFKNEFDAEIVCGYLKSAGINAIFLRYDAGSMRPPQQEMEGVHVLVRRDQEENARRILAENRVAYAR